MNRARIVIHHNTFELEGEFPIATLLEQLDKWYTIVKESDDLVLHEVIQKLDQERAALKAAVDANS